MEEWKNGRMDSLAVIGESHCLAIHRTKLKFNQHAYQSQAYWIAGIKMWHLAQTPDHPMKHKIRQLLPNIAIATPLLLTIGEIDCRFDEGIWVAAKKQNCHCSVLIEKTITGYLDWLATQFKRSGHTQIIIQGIPAPNDIKNIANSLDKPATFFNMIKEVNQHLEYYTLKKGWKFLDVYSATVDNEGKSNQQWHLDSCHLKPSFYDQAARWMKD